MRSRALLAFFVAFLGFSVHAEAQDWALSTNIVEYVNLGTLNAEAHYAFDRHWNVSAGVRYNPFEFSFGEEGGARNKQQSYALGLRFWPWHIYSGWWLSGKVQYQEYNAGGLFSKETREGDRFGTGFTGGYTHMLTKWLNLEFGLGFWTGYDDYTEYACPVCGVVTDKGKKFFVLPDDVIIALSFIF